jgi:hypothetical protein
MIDHTKATPELFASLAIAQGEVENASKSSSNPHFRSKYADLAEVLNTVRPVFAKHGLSIAQSTSFNGSLVSVSTLIAHASGGLIVSEASCVPGKTDAQGIGAATTYLRRYSLAAMAGIAQEDDDGNAAAHNGKPQPVVSPGPIPTAEKVAKDAHDAALARHSESIVYIRESLDAGNIREACEEWAQIPQDDQRALWLAPSKGGVLTTQQRQTIKENASKYAQQEKAA